MNVPAGVVRNRVSCVQWEIRGCCYVAANSEYKVTVCPPTCRQPVVLLWFSSSPVCMSCQLWISWAESYLLSVLILPFMTGYHLSINLLYVPVAGKTKVSWQAPSQPLMLNKLVSTLMFTVAATRVQSWRWITHTAKASIEMFSDEEMSWK